MHTSSVSLKGVALLACLAYVCRSWSHGLARQEATRQEADANGEQEHAANAADSAAQGAAPALAAPPAATPGRRGRPKLSRKEQYEQQASLWRALHRFVKDALSIVVIQASIGIKLCRPRWLLSLHQMLMCRFYPAVPACISHGSVVPGCGRALCATFAVAGGRPSHLVPLVLVQEKTNAPKRAILLKELELLQEDLEAAVEMYSGGKGYDELCHQMGRSLLHSVLQHKRFAQVGSIMSCVCALEHCDWVGCRVGSALRSGTRRRLPVSPVTVWFVCSLLC